jgi:DNA-binding transcriptional MerR regulator
MNTYTISELAAACGLSVHTLRFYEKAGILQAVARAGNGHRRYQDSDRLWLEFVLRLKQTGMPLDQIRNYADLRAAGDASLEPRMQMLQQHRSQLLLELAALHANLEALEQKITLYQTQIKQRKANHASTSSSTSKPRQRKQ